VFRSSTICQFDAVNVGTRVVASSRMNSAEAGNLLCLCYRKCGKAVMCKRTRCAASRSSCYTSVGSLEHDRTRWITIKPRSRYMHQLPASCGLSLQDREQAGCRPHPGGAGIQRESSAMSIERVAVRGLRRCGAYPLAARHLRSAQHAASP
jgi:hypothetical protein